MSLRLTIRSPHGGSFDAVFDTDEVRVGRASFCELRLPYRVVSSHHLTIRAATDDRVLVDEGSTNGTWIDGSRIEPGTEVPLHDGLVVEIVDVELEFSFVRDDVEGFTLAESGTMLRKMVSDAAGTATDDDLAFFEVLDGPDAGRRLRIPDEADGLTLGSDADSDFVLSGGPPRIGRVGRRGEGFEIVPAEASLTLDGRPLHSEGASLFGGARLAVEDGPRLVFFDPLEDYIREIDEEREPENGVEGPNRHDHLTPVERVLVVFGLTVIVAAIAALAVIFDLF